VASDSIRSVWRWRIQYGEVLGGLGTGIGEGDRGVTCGREDACRGAKEREQETDCDAEYARDSSTTPWAVSLAIPTGGGSSSNASSSLATSSSASLTGTSPGSSHGADEHGGSPGRRTPSPQLGPGYERHEIEGIGGIVKKKLVRMVRVGACVPEWADERTNREIMGREVRGQVRSWCGWCWRVIPGGKDMEVK